MAHLGRCSRGAKRVEYVIRNVGSTMIEDTHGPHGSSAFKATMDEFSAWRFTSQVTPPATRTAVRLA